MTPSAKKRRDKARGRVNRHTDLLKTIAVFPEEKLDALLETAKNPLFLVLDGIQDPHNLGACLRVADAAGVDAVVVPKNRAASITPTVRKIACGGAESVTFVQVVNIPRTLEKMARQGVFVVGTSDKASETLYDFDLTGPTAIVIGAEASGMKRLTSERCEALASIPMSGKVECLNASVSAGVVLFEAVRQRRTLGKKP